jgi:hypothetical protein
MRKTEATYTATQINPTEPNVYEMPKLYITDITNFEVPSSIAAYAL